MTALWIATKHEEVYPVDVGELLHVCDNKFQRKELIAFEKDILITVNFKITIPTAFYFLKRYRRICSLVSNHPSNNEVFHFAHYILETSLLDACLLRFRPSQLAASALVISCRRLKRKSPWSGKCQEMETLTGY